MDPFIPIIIRETSSVVASCVVGPGLERTATTAIPGTVLNDLTNEYSLGTP